MTFHTLSEILSQPAAWQEALDLVHSQAQALKTLATGDYDQVLFTGCGSTYYLSLAAAALFQEATGRMARAVPGGELCLNSDTVLGRMDNPTDKKTLLVAISRSGVTTETVWAVEQFKAQRRGKVLVFTNYDSALAALGDERMIITAGQEESVAQTRSFASMYVAAAAFAVLAGGRDDLFGEMNRLPGAGERLIEQYKSFAKELGEDLNLDRFYFLGSGARYGLACEINLKMKEMTLTHSEPFHFLEFRHGPMSMVNRQAMIVGMVSDKNSRHEHKVLEEMRTLGGRILSLAETSADVCFTSGIPEPARGVLYLPVLQLLAFYRARAKNLNPDRPENLSAVVTLELPSPNNSP